jgi:proteasome maturation protein
METLRRTFGIAEPIRRQMELKITKEGSWQPTALTGGLPSVHEDILKGKDNSITWEDVFTCQESTGLTGIHDEIEKKVNM